MYYKRIQDSLGYLVITACNKSKEVELVYDGINMYAKLFYEGEEVVEYKIYNLEEFKAVWKALEYPIKQ